MSPLVERYAPNSPVVRVLLATVLLVPVAAWVGGLLETVLVYGGPISSLLVFGPVGPLLGVGAALVAGLLLRSVARRAAETPEPDWWGGDDSSSAGGDDPVALLRERYARGELDDEEFERRVEALVETEGSGENAPDRDREHRGEAIRRHRNTGGGSTPGRTDDRSGDGEGRRLPGEHKQRSPGPTGELDRDEDSRRDRDRDRE
jgi:uncharacterized membrane protein